MSGLSFGFMRRLSKLVSVVPVLILAITSTQAQERTISESESANKLAVTSRKLPVGIPEDYVITPFGYLHPSCLRLVAKGEQILPDGRIRHVDGTVDAKVPICNYPRYSPKGSLLTSDKSWSSQSETPPQPNGWLEWIHATTSTSFGKLTATWSVPSLPALWDGQVLFFFPGFEENACSGTNCTILQPVLQYGLNGSDSQPPTWQIASYQAFSQSNGMQAYESVPVNVEPGDDIYGRISSNCAAGTSTCPTWDVEITDLTTGLSSALDNTPSEGQAWNVAFGAVLEQYQVDDCDDYPAQSNTDLSVLLYNQKFKLISEPAWGEDTAGSGTDPWCNFGLSTTPNEELLQYTGGSYTLTTDPKSAKVELGGSVSTTVTVNPANGFSEDVTLSIPELPSGVTAAFDPATTNNSSTLTLNAGASSALGKSDLTVTGTTASGLQKTVDVTLNVVSPKYPLHVAVFGAAGSVTSTPSGINCSTSCSAQFESAISVTLAASPANGSVFAGWAGSCSGTSTNLSVTVTGAMTCLAIFSDSTTTVSFAGCGGGQCIALITPDPPGCSPITITQIDYQLGPTNPVIGYSWYLRGNGSYSEQQLSTTYYAYSKDDFAAAYVSLWTPQTPPPFDTTFNFYYYTYTNDVLYVLDASCSQ
jgi:hypothetical protein